MEPRRPEFVPELERSIMDAWPGDTEFVIMRAEDWSAVADQVEKLGHLTKEPFHRMKILPVVLDLPERGEWRLR